MAKNITKGIIKPTKEPMYESELSSSTADNGTLMLVGRMEGRKDGFGFLAVGEMAGEGMKEGKSLRNSLVVGDMDGVTIMEEEGDVTSSVTDGL
mmetsp:Transcript_15598/g.23627  ORF Transcript_15598/g.23627 Transcript_15598/m.23627 type:complete len:94 (+) Transcript_15598:1451-1732(+)